MKKLFLCISILMLVSCGSPLSKKYDPKTYGSDIAEIEKEITPEEKALLNQWVLAHSVDGKDVEMNGLTYQQLLDNAKKMHEEKKEEENTFMATKYTNMDNFFTELQKQVDDHLIDMDERDASCLGYFLAYKERDSSAFSKTYEQIIKEAPDFCKENKDDY